MPLCRLTLGCQPTQGSANPALTIMALAARTADHLAARASGGTT